MRKPELAPIVLFTYNRVEHTRQTLESLAKNKLASDSTLYIYADGSKPDASSIELEAIKNTRELIRTQQWCKEVQIIESDTNKGLAKSITEGVTEVVNKHGKAIVLEDDIQTSPFFLEYMNKALDLYENESKVMHISAFVPKANSKIELPDTFFLRFMSCWGWATWKRSWNLYIDDINYLYKEIPTRKDFGEYNLGGSVNMFEQIEGNYNGIYKTWAIKWYSTIFLHNGLCLYPKQSLVLNIGFDGSGAHCPPSTKYDVAIANEIRIEKISKLKENKEAKKYLKKFYDADNGDKRNIIVEILGRIKLRLKNILNK